MSVIEQFLHILTRVHKPLQQVVLVLLLPPPVRNSPRTLAGEVFLECGVGHDEDVGVDLSGGATSGEGVVELRVESAVAFGLSDDVVVDLFDDVEVFLFEDGVMEVREMDMLRDVEGLVRFIFIRFFTRFLKLFFYNLGRHFVFLCSTGSNTH